MKKIIFALIAGATAMAAAQAQTVPGPYVGVGINSVDNSANISGATNVDSDGRKTSGKIFAGYNFNNTWAAEVAYSDFRSADFNYNLNGNAGNGSTDGNSYYVAGKATTHFNDQFALFGKLGIARTKNNLSSTTPGYNFSNTKTEGYGAIGVEYNINKQVALSLEYERYGNTKDFGAQANVFTVAAKYAF